MALVSCAGLRQVARQLSLTRAPVTWRVERLARRCLLLNRVLEPRGAPAEPLGPDGFETLDRGRCLPMHANLLAGTDSRLVRGFTESERRAALEVRHGRPEPGAVHRGVEALLTLAILAGAKVGLRADQRPARVRAIRLLADRRHVRHRATSSMELRTTRKPLNPANLTDLFARHGSGNRERKDPARKPQPLDRVRRRDAAAVRERPRTALRPMSPRVPPNSVRARSASSARIWPSSVSWS